MSLGSLPPEPVPADVTAGGLVTVAPSPDEAAVAAGMLPAGKPRSTFRRGLEVFLENKLAVTGVCIFAFMLLFCFIGPLVYHTNQLTVDFAHEELPPSGAHPLGTDASGFDVLGRLMVRTRDYVQAMKVMGGGGTRSVLRHIAPNAIGTIMVTLTFTVADAIALIVALSYLGLGIRPPQTDWGGMLSNGVQYVYDGYWWLIIPAGFCIVIVIAAAIFIGEGLRDAVEVRLQRR
jgi:ABC-type dipeptide/oligopeptide/nickel transport system permease subunit